MVWAAGNPEQDAALRELIQEQHSDRVVAIVGAAVCENALEEALKSRFRSTTGHSSDINEKRFRVGGALGVFAPKIDIGYQLYVFEKPIRNAMYGIADIRNLLAHRLDMNFQSTDSRMVTAFAKLTLHQGITHYPNPITEKVSEHKIEPITTNKDKFIINLKLCLLWLFGDNHRHGLWTNIPITWGPRIDLGAKELRQPEP